MTDARSSLPPLPGYPPAPPPSPWAQMPVAQQWAPPVPSAPRPSGETISWPDRHPGGGCSQCGAANATRFRFRRNIGMVLAFKSYHYEGVLCRNCAQHVGRDFQAKTLVLGWWGILAMIVNVVAIARNTIQLRKARALGLPIAPACPPLAPGRPVLMRPISYIGPLIIALWLGWVFTNDTPSAFAAGDCIAVDRANSDRFTGVDCAAAHDGRIVAVTKSADDCPLETDASGKSNDEFVCITFGR